MNCPQQTLNKISYNNKVVGIIGLGFVGLPLAENFAQAEVNFLITIL